ncbi:Uncharacterized protein TCM_012613 [Theobroma cacao]|uniref:Uncharacterized protein n=1 Tax=Theobroma cacao TaxID=3641 RepID=A0A061FVI1_THECC|nr:Uncharacterized protein TCM_012613 [Theobroma cacao]
MINAFKLKWARPKQNKTKRVIPCWAAIGPTRRPVGAQIQHPGLFLEARKVKSKTHRFDACEAAQNDAVLPGPSSFCLPL